MTRNISDMYTLFIYTQTQIDKVYGTVARQLERQEAEKDKYKSEVEFIYQVLFIDQMEKFIQTNGEGNRTKGTRI